MGLNPITIEQFPGIDLRQDPGDSRGAIDLLNVTLLPGAVRSRFGSTLHFTPTGSPVFLAPFVVNGAVVDEQMIVGANPSIYALSRAGGSLGSTTTPSSGIDGFSGTALGTAAGSFFYAVGGTGIGGAARRWDGSTWTTPGGSFPANPSLATVSPTDNRLLIASNNTRKVSFSDPGDPTTFGANNFVMLTPGDGEEYCGAVTFNNQAFVFKQTKFFVFYGTSVDSTGNPVFNYRTVAGIGMHWYEPQSVVAGTDGVYFLSQGGVYKTTGGTPVCVSRPLEPYLYATTNAFWSGSSWSSSNFGSRLAWVNDCLYFSPAQASGGVTFIYDPRLDAWTAWGIGAFGMAAGPDIITTGRGHNKTLYYADTTKVYRIDPTQTTDNGAAIVSRYRLPFETYGTPREKRIRETILEGTGTPTVQWSKDWGSLVTGSAVALGTAPAIGTGRQRLAIQGRAFSLQLGAASGAWSVNRVRPNLGEGLRGPEVTV